MYKILVTGAIHEVGLEMLRQEKDLEVQYAPDLPLVEILKLVAPIHCILTRSETPISRELIDKAPNLKVIARAAVGIGNIDVGYATEKGILVINTPGKNTNSAAELTIGLLLSAVRKIIPAHSHMNELKWDRHNFTGTELLGKTIGIIGLGNVGHRVARYAKAFEMQVLAYDPYIADEVFERHHAKKCTWEELISSADVITLHVPKTEETTGMIGAEEFSRMKTGVVILNSARGGVIQEKPLLKELQSGKVAAAGIDTWEVEPPKENPFRQLPQVVMSPHVGASTTEAQIRIAESIAIQAPRALRGEVVDYPVNMPSVQVLDSGPVSSYASLAEKLGVFSSQFIEFTPTQLEIRFRGNLANHDGTLLRLCFLKGLLQDKQDFVSYVNADRQAENAGLHIEEKNDPGFTDYESALKCTLSASGRQFAIGGVVFSGPHPRITLINNFVCEIEAEGIILATTNQDRPGMVGLVGTCLGKNGVNIDQFQLARNTRGGEALSLIRVDDDLPESVVEEIRQQEGITSVCKIIL
ncbi:MAG: phosphoglycerate dehydrogenase [SAR324 cluster bacterium]|nr:phosphoglycerate dehydrogenase [SAR324 cluster bacterium]MBL7035968.1 phosphoglycerate dehydrogenase [SAR324 cluster bacterium]